MVLSFARKGYLACVLSMLAIGMSHGQSKLDSIQHLDEVTVTARSFSFKEVIPSQKLSGKELQNLNSHTVADALRYFSGVQLKDYGGVGGIKTVNIRSMGTNHMGVFYDGIELSNAQNGQVDLGMYSLDNIEEISLYNGAIFSNPQKISVRPVRFICVLVVLVSKMEKQRISVPR